MTADGRIRVVAPTPKACRHASVARSHSDVERDPAAPPTRQDADAAVLFIGVSGCLGMRSRGAIGVAPALVEKGIAEPTRPVTRASRGPGRTRRWGERRVATLWHPTRQARAMCDE